MALSDLFSKLQIVVKENAAGIHTGLAVVGTIGTSIFTAQASFKAARIIQETEDILEKESNFVGVRLDKREKIKLVWKQYIPAAAMGGITITNIILANRVAGKQAAALAAALSLTEKAFGEYREQVVKTLGEAKETTAVHDKIAEARMSKDPVNTREVILAGTGEVLCYDILSGRYFQSSIEEIKAAQNTVNAEIINYMSASLSRFYDEIGLTATGHSDTVGFNSNRLIEVRFSTQMSVDGRPCVAIDFVYDPISNYNKLWGD